MTTATAALSTTSTERAHTIATLVMAFSDDPVVRWTYPGTDQYLVHFPEFVQVLGGAAFDAGTADRTDGGAALWVPPDTPSDDEALGELVERSIDLDRQPDMFAFAEEATGHRPTTPHWYLAFIGVDPLHQGRGKGSELLAQGLARCDADGLPAYLDASSPRNRALYERHGFEVIAEVQAGDSPPMWSMLRPAR